MPKVTKGQIINGENMMMKKILKYAVVLLVFAIMFWFSHYALQVVATHMIEEYNLLNGIGM